MSLGGSGYSQAEYDAIQGAVDKGVTFAVAAGNDSDLASNHSPAAFNNVLTVSALADFNGLPGGLAPSTCRADQDDTLADFSNFGAAVDIAAPGVCIRSTYPIEKGEYGTISGTSMASPHVAGALALLASNPYVHTATGVHALYNAVKAAGNFNWTDKPGDPQERLLDVSDVSTFRPRLEPGPGGGGSDTTAPIVDITSPDAAASFSIRASITFIGTATDDINGDLTSSLEWSSNKDGRVGTGGLVTTTSLTAGEHIITASAKDQANNTGKATITITITADPVDQPTLIGTATPEKGNWTATVKNSAGSLVSGSWDEGSSCTLVTECSLTVPKKVPSVTFTSTSGETVTILKP